MHKLWIAHRWVGFVLLVFSPHSFASTALTEDMAFFREKANNDTVAKILNYSEGIDESGTDNAFWYPFNQKECIYRKGALVEFLVEIPAVITKDSSNAPSAKSTFVKETTFNENMRELHLNTWTPSTVKVGYIQHAGTWWGPNNFYLQIMANGIPMLESILPRDLERTQAAWNLVFNRYCPGRKNNF